MNLRIRPFVDSDHEASARIFTTIFPDFPMSPDDSRRIDQSRHNVGLTGVTRECRRQGIAKALKLHTIRYAQQHGYAAIETGANSTNHAILVLNLSVGFQKTYAWVTFEKQLNQSPMEKELSGMTSSAESCAGYNIS